MISSAWLENLFLTKGFLFLLVFARVVGVLMPLPLFSSATAPKKLRFVTAIALSLIAFPLVSDVVPGNMLSTPFAWIDEGAILLLEFFTGLAVGLAAAIFLMILTFLGELASRLGGWSAVSVFDPLTRESLSPLGSFLTLTGIVVFLCAGGLESLVTGLYDSFARLCPGTLPNYSSVLKTLNVLLSEAFSLTLRLAFPLMISSLTVWFTAGLLSRAASGMSLMPLGFSANLLLTILILYLSLNLVMTVLQGELSTFWKQIGGFYGG